MWTVETIETQLPEGEHVFELPLREGETEALVLIEQLGTDAPFEAQIEGLEGNQHSRYARARVFMGTVVGDSRRMLVRLQVSGPEIVRITVAKMREGMKAAWPGLRCRLCKKLVGILLTAALAMVGVPYLDPGFTLDGDVLNADILGEIGELPERFETLRHLIDDVDLGIWETMLDLLEGLDRVFEALDRFYDAVCQRLGMCTPRRD